MQTKSKASLPTGRWYQWVISFILVSLLIIGSPLKHIPPDWFWPFQIVLYPIISFFPLIFGILVFVSLFRLCLKSKLAPLLTAILGILSIIPCIMIVTGLPYFYFGFLLMCIQDAYQKGNFVVALVLFLAAVMTVQFLQLAFIRLWKYCSDIKIFSSQKISNRTIAKIAISLVTAIIAIYFVITIYMYPTYNWVLPNNYKGWFVVIFKDPSGPKAQFNGKDFVYKVPEDGFGVTASSPNTLMTKVSYIDGTPTNGSKGIVVKDFGIIGQSGNSNDTVNVHWVFVGSREEAEKAKRDIAGQTLYWDWKNHSNNNTNGVLWEYAQKTAEFGDYAKAEKLYRELSNKTDEQDGKYSANALLTLYMLEGLLNKEGKTKEADVIKQDLIARIPKAIESGESLSDLRKNAIIDGRKEEAEALKK